MRRITLKHAKPGMIVELPVYDSWGTLLLNKDKELDASLIAGIAVKGVPEVFIRDWRVMEVLVAPLFSPQTEGILAKAFRQLVLDNTGKMSIDANNIKEVHTAVGGIVREISLNVNGDFDVSCFISPKEYLYLQPVKTAGLALAIGRGLKLSFDELVILGMAAVLKDVGLPSETINSVDYLAEGDSPKTHEHPQAGHDLLMQHQLTGGEVAEAVLQHHESWSGKGYPRGLKGKEISRYAQIIAISEAYVDLLVERPGRERYMPHEAVDYIMASSGDQLDPELVQSFVKQIPSYPV